MNGEINPYYSDDEQAALTLDALIAHLEDMIELAAEQAAELRKDIQSANNKYL